MSLVYAEGGIEIHHGDCRELEFGGIDLVLTDPPYGINAEQDYSRFNSASNRNWGGPITGDTEPFDPSPLLALGRCILWGGNYFAPRLPVGGWIIWNKRDCRETPLLMNDAEMAWTNATRAIRVFNWFWSGRYRKGEVGQGFHPAQKPVALMRWLIEAFTEPGQLVYDPYMGSGPVAKAAQETGRRYIGVEIEARYCETAIRRLAQTPMFVKGVVES